MSKYNLYSKIFLFTLIINFPFLIAIPAESDFVSLKSREISYYELTQSKNEVYYSFQNNIADSDIIINFKIGKGFTTFCYVYDSYNSIKQNDQGDYINAIKEFATTENYIILKSGEMTISKVKYYLVIKNTFNTYNKDYISIFNEQDTYELQNEKFILFNSFYSKKSFNLEFSVSKNQLATLELNIQDPDYSQIVNIYNEQKELIYTGVKNTGEIKLNEDLDTEGKYSLVIETEEEPYVEIQSSIVLHLEEKKVKEIKFDSPLSLSYNKNKIFNFYVDLSQYDYEEEGIITFKFGNQIKEKKLIEHCYAKAMNFETNDDNKFISNTPANEEENEAKFTALSGTEDIYQLYFKNTQNKAENKTTYLLIHLHIQIEEHETSEFLYPEEFSIYLSQKPELIDLVKYKDSTDFILNTDIQLNYYVPVLYKIKFPTGEIPIKLSYVFYTSEIIQTVYNNSMLNDDHTYEKNRMLYALSPIESGYDYTKILYIKIYGFSSEKINFRIESTESDIYYIHNDYRKIRTFSNRLTDCKKSFYYIGDYGSLVTKGYFYQEEVYGKINTFYKNKISTSDKSILINSDSSYLKENFFPLETSIDIIELKCQSPGYYQAHLLDDIDTRNIDLYSKVYNYISKDKNLIINPVLSPITENINFEIYNPFGKKMQINDGKNVITLDEKNKYYQVQYKYYNATPSQYTVTSEEDAVISITLTNKDSFVIVDKDTDIDYDSQVIVKLKKEKSYESINIIITRIYHGYSYSLFKGNANYAGKLIESEYDYIKADRSHKINMTLPNPYLYLSDNDKETNDENEAFYLIYSIDDPELIQKTVKLIYKAKENHDTIKPEESKIFKENDIYTLNKTLDKNLSIIYKSCGNTLDKIDITDTAGSSLQTITNTKISSYGFDELERGEIDKNLHVIIKGTQKDVPSELKGAFIGITEKEITQEKIDSYINKDLPIKYEGNGKLSWDKVDNMNNFDVYIVDKNNTYKDYLDNPCLLNYIKEQNVFSEESNGDNTTYMKHFSTSNNYLTFKENGNYTVVVSSIIENDIPLLYIYKPLAFNSSYVPDDEDGDGLDSSTVLFLAIALPLVVIGVIILLFTLIKCKKNKDDEDRIDNEECDDNKEPIIRETDYRTSEV